MFRAAPRLLVRPAVRAAPLRSFAPTRRALSTSPPAQKSRSWKSLAARIGLAGAIIYYYNTTDVFAEEPRHAVHALPETEVESEHLPTIETIAEERKRRQAVQQQLDAQKQKQQDTASAQQNAKPANGGEGGIQGLEEEADQQGAFNPETGEINWDCPCLGGMAHGPCGEEFKAAFSCFVYSTEEPKGMNCIDKFKNMQNCFREYPDVYGSELEADADDDDDEGQVSGDLAASEAAPSASTTRSTPASLTSSDVSSDAQTAPSSKSTHDSSSDRPTSATRKLATQASSQTRTPEQVEENRRGEGLVPESYRQSAKDATKQSQSQEPVSESESEQLVPKAARDASEEDSRSTERK
ncbi:Oxidoreductase [Coniothyrium glycines]